MTDSMIPVDVISVCESDGNIRPLRIRMECDGQQPLRIDIAGITDTMYVPRVGSEAYIYACQARIGRLLCSFALKYSVRNHKWWLMNTIEQPEK